MNIEALLAEWKEALPFILAGRDPLDNPLHLRDWKNSIYDRQKNSGLRPTINLMDRKILENMHADFSARPAMRVLADTIGAASTGTATYRLARLCTLGYAEISGNKRNASWKLTSKGLEFLGTI